MNRDFENFAVCERAQPGDTHFQLEHATLGQRLLWSLDRLRGASGALNCPAACYIDGPLDVTRLYAAIGTVVATHAALRATIIPGRTLQQKFAASCSPPLRVVDLSSSPHDVAAALRTEFSTRIDPTRSAIRISLLKLRADSHLLIINAHHLFTDLWSSNVLIEDLACALERSPRARADRETWDFITYSRWERQCAQAGGFARQQRYWFERLAGMNAIAVPLAPVRFDIHGSRGLIETTIEAATRVRLETIARGRQASPFAALLAVLFAMTWRRTGERDLAVASLFSNRGRPELKRTVGFLVNMVMLRVRVGGAPSFEDFIDQCQRASSGAFTNADLPYHALSPRPLSRTIAAAGRADDFVFHATPDAIDVRHDVRHDVADLTIRSIVPEVVGRFDAELAVRPAAAGLLVRLTYNEHRLAAHDARDILKRYAETARLLCSSAPDMPLTRCD